MTGFIENAFMSMEGLNEQDEANINAILPDIQHLDQVLIAEWPKINKIVTILAPIIGKVAAKQRSLT